jgi:hypothetical protein
MRLEELSLGEWERALPSTGFEVFHTPSALSTLADHVPGSLRLFGGFKGDQPVGLLPVFVRNRSVGRAALSPPPSRSVPRLGPLTMPTSPKRRKRERVNRRFTEAVLDELDVDSSRALFRVTCPLSYEDPRPYVWSDLDVSNRFTYVLETVNRTPDEVLSSFSKSLRREIRDAREADVTVTPVSPEEGAEAVFEDTKSRYEEQDRSFGLTWSYVDDLTKSLREDRRCRVYLARDDDGEYLSGITVLYSNDVAYFWQGGTRTDHDGVAVNSLLHWRIIRDLVESPPRESVTGYDLMGANTERLCRYKAKFGADLRPYYLVESAGSGMDVAKRAYRLFSG